MEDGNFSEIEIFVHALHSSWLSIMILWLGSIMIFGSYPEWIFEKCLKGGVGLIILIVLFFSGGDIFNVTQKNNERGTPGQIFTKS